MIFSILFLSGCWDSREITDIGLVIAVGVDKSEDSNGFAVTVQIANPQANASQEKKSSSNEPIWILTAKGETLFEAVREMSKVSSKRIVWGHNSIVIIGESLAKDDIAPVIDYFTHNPELRMKAHVLVSKGDAKNYLSLKTSLDDISGISLSDVLTNNFLTSQYIHSDMLRLSQEYFNEHKQPILSMIQFKKEMIKPSEENKGELLDMVELGGAAIFNKGKMIGTLTPEQVRGYSWIKLNVKDTLVTVNYENQKKASVEMKNVKSKIITSISEDVPSIEIKITGLGEIAEEDGSTELSIEDFKKKIGDLVKQKIIEEAENCLNVVQKQYNVDTFAFAHIFHMQQTLEWKKSIEENWETIYPDIQISVSCDIKITGSVLNQIPSRAPEKVN